MMIPFLECPISLTHSYRLYSIYRFIEWLLTYSITVHFRKIIFKYTGMKIGQFTIFFEAFFPMFDKLINKFQT